VFSARPFEAKEKRTQAARCGRAFEDRFGTHFLHTRIWTTMRIGVKSDEQLQRLRHQWAEIQSQIANA
jgi:hypothetical protein